MKIMENTSKDEILDKGRELFTLCDKDGKGFITRADLECLGTDLVLSVDQLTTVFDGLDEDGNGYLTLSEFLEGFAGHIGKALTPLIAEEGQFSFEDTNGNLEGLSSATDEGQTNNELAETLPYERLNTEDLNDTQPQEQQNSVLSAEKTQAQDKYVEEFQNDQFEDEIQQERKIEDDAQENEQFQFAQLKEEPLEESQLLEDPFLLGNFQKGPVRAEKIEEDMNAFPTAEELEKSFQNTLDVQSQDHDCSPTTPTPTNDEESFDSLLEHLGARNIFQDEEAVEAIWKHLRKQDPNVVLEFEHFLSKICGELKQTRFETTTLQMALESKSSTYEEQMKKLYEEMELQIRAEKDRILQEERGKEKRTREELEEQLELKDRYLSEMISKHTEMERKLGEVNTADIEAKSMNYRLIKEKETLEQQLESSQTAITEMRKSLDFLRQQNLEEKRRRAKAAFNVSESIALEREELVKQLDLLKVINKQLQDERDEKAERLSQTLSLVDSDIGKGETLGLQSSNSSVTGGQDFTSPFLKRGSIMGDYVDPSKFSKGQQQLPQGTSSSSMMDNTTDFGQSSTDGFLTKHLSKRSNDPSYYSFSNPEPEPLSRNGVERRSMSPFADDFVPSQNEVFEKNKLDDDDDEEEIWNMESVSRVNEPTDRRRLQEFSSNATGEEKKIINPQRLFKVVFIGDSGVGKSSFIHRFCTNTFRSTFSATIGVDFQIKHVECNGQTVVMQLWDTAGQERFRSITHQYMRKADGVVIVYDVTSESSFKNVRSWITCVRDVTEDDTAILLVGNKTDLCVSDKSRAIKATDGVRLSEECQALFYEASVKNNICVVESMHELAKRLQEKQDLEIERALQLHMQTRKKSACCS